MPASFWRCAWWWQLTTGQPYQVLTTRLSQQGPGRTSFPLSLPAFSPLWVVSSRVSASLVPRPHPRGEEKGSGYNTMSHPTLEGRNQHTIVSDHVLTYAILSMPCGPHCGAYYSNCAVIGHFTCQTAYVTGSSGMSYCNQTLLLREGGVWARDSVSAAL